jgi:hypothetical protein
MQRIGTLRKVTTEPVECPCGTVFDAEVMTLGEVRVAPTHCPACYLAIRNQPVHAGRVATTEDQVLEDMEWLGVNLQEHGWLEYGPNAGKPATLDNLGISPGVTAARNFVRRLVDAGRWRAVVPLYLWGPTGTGKSQTGVAVIRAALEAGIPRQEIVYDRGRAMVTQLQDRYTTGTVDEFSAKRGRARLWVYDDTGTEKLTPSAFAAVEDILDRRGGKASLITANHNREETANRWASQDGWVRLRSRLGPYHEVEMGGQDWRFVERGEVA